MLLFKRNLNEAGRQIMYIFETSLLQYNKYGLLENELCIDRNNVGLSL